MRSTPNEKLYDITKPNLEHQAPIPETEFLS